MPSSSSKKIAKNTGLLYARMAIVMVINLYTVRIVLNALGQVDYGIYDVVAGIIVMFQNLSSVLSIATQRYYSNALGERNVGLLNSVFASSIKVNFLFSLIVILIGETIGLWFLNTHLDIPEIRMNAANWVYQFTIISFVATIMQIPFSSAVVAYEDMGYYAVISLVSCSLKLVTAFVISKTGFDKLVIYGLLLMLISVFELVTYSIITRKKYSEMRFSRHNANLQKELLTFSGWTLFGTAASVGTTQVCTFLVNIFFGPVVNAARAVAFQVHNAINSFGSSFLTAVRPPMIKSYAEKNYSYLNKLFDFSTKFVFYTLLMIVIPLYIDMEYLLKLWLSNDDPQTTLFCRLMLVYSIILCLNNPITFIMHAGGFVKQYHVRVEIPTLAIMPITYILFKVGLPAYTTYITMIIAVVLSHIIRLWCLHKYYPQYDLREYFKSFVLKAFIISSFVTLLLYYIHSLMPNGIGRLMILLGASIILVGIMTYCIGLSKYEKNRVKGSLSSFFMKKQGEEHE